PLCLGVLRNIPEPEYDALAGTVACGGVNAFQFLTAHPYPRRAELVGVCEKLTSRLGIKTASWRHPTHKQTNIPDPFFGVSTPRLSRIKYGVPGTLCASCPDWGTSYRPRWSRISLTRSPLPHPVRPAPSRRIERTT